MGVNFDSLKYVQTLEGVGMERKLAEALAALTRDEILAQITTKADLNLLEERFEAQVKASAQSVTIKFGTMLIAATTLLFAALVAYDQLASK